jgi:hypothetical protein
VKSRCLCPAGREMGKSGQRKESGCDAEGYGRAEGCCSAEG